MTARNRRLVAEGKNFVGHGQSGLPVTGLGQMKNRLTKLETGANDERLGERAPEPDIPGIFSKDAGGARTEATR